MADTSGLGHIPSTGWVEKGPLNRDKVDLRLLPLFDKLWYPDDKLIFPVHITIDEKDGYVSPFTLLEIGRVCGYRTLKGWYGNGITGETFALQGIISTGQLTFISRQPGVKFIWLLNDRKSWTVDLHVEV